MGKIDAVTDVYRCGLQAEFQRLALGFKCDMFTLEKRLRLEERSRDLAEENVRREVSSCQGLLQASRLEFQAAALRLKFAPGHLF